MGGRDSHPSAGPGCRRAIYPTVIAGRRPWSLLLAVVVLLVSVGVGAAGCGGVLTAQTPTSGPPATPEAAGSPPAARDLAPSEGPFSVCPDCHAYLDPPAAERPLLTDDFGHVSHLDRGAACEDCHLMPVHGEQGTRRPGMADCFTCHGLNPDAAAPGECALCHPPDMPLVPASHTEEFFEGGHVAAVEEQGARECLVCHAGDEETLCENCHGLSLPHPEGWVSTDGPDPGDHVDWAHEDALLCVACHDNTEEAAPPGCYQGECHGPR